MINFNTSYSQEIPDNFARLDTFIRPLSIIKTNPLPILWGPIPLTSEYRLIYETSTFYNQSVSIGVSYLGKNMLVNLFSLIDSSLRSDWEKLKIRGIRGQISYKFFIGKKKPHKIYGPHGLYIGPLLSYSSAKVTDEYFSVRRNFYMKFANFNLNCITGLQIIAFNKFSFDMFSGLGYRYNVFIVNYLNQPNISRMIILPLDDVPFFKNLKFTLGFNLGYCF